MQAYCGLLILVFASFALCAPQSHYGGNQVYGDNSGECPEYGVYAYPHETACDQYYQCLNGTFSHEKCPNGLVFDDKSPIHEFCNYFWQIDCGDRKEVEPPISTPDCPWEWGLFPSDTCTHYHKCAWGESNLTACAEGLAYIDDTHTCTWPDEVPGCDSEAIVGFKCPEKIVGMPAKFYPYPRYPHPECNKLFVCVNGKPRLLNCGYGSAFNLETYTCDSIDNVPDCKLRY